MTKDELIAAIDSGEYESDGLIGLLTRYIKDKDISDAVIRLYE